MRFVDRTEGPNVKRWKQSFFSMRMKDLEVGTENGEGMGKCFVFAVGHKEAA